MNHKLLSKQVAVVLMIIPLFIAAAYIQFQPERPQNEHLDEPEAKQVIEVEDKQEKLHTLGTPLIDIDLLTRDEATKYGIRGYVKMKLAHGTPSEYFNVSGKELNIKIQLSLVQFDRNLTKVKVKLNPKGQYGVTIEKVLGDDRGTIKLNDYVSYQPTGQITLKAGQTLNVMMTIRIPEDFPRISIPLGPVGITSDVPISDRIRGSING